MAKFDFYGHHNRGLASLDQRIQVARQYYDSLNPEQRQAFVALVRKVSERFPINLDEYVTMLCDAGLNEDRSVDIDITVHFGVRTAKIAPQHLAERSEHGSAARSSRLPGRSITHEGE